MEIQVSELEYCKLNVKYSTDADAVSRKKALVLDKFRKLSIPGNRPGKASNEAILAHFKKEVDKELMNEMLADAYEDALFETKAKTIGQPQVVDVKLTAFGFSCELIILKKPDFELKKYKGFELPKPHQEKDENTLAEQMLQELREKSGDVVPYSDNDFVQTNDKVTMDLLLTADGEEDIFEEGRLYLVGSNGLSGLDDALMGMTPGDEREFDLVYKDKPAKAKVTLHMGMKTIPAEANDEFAKRYGFEDMASFMGYLISLASSKIKESNEAKLTQQIAKRLVEENVFEVPQWLSNMETQMLALQTGVVWDELNDEAKKSIKDRADESIRLSLILDSIRDADQTSSMSDSEILNYLARLLLMEGKDPDKELKEMENNGKLINLVATLRNEFTMQWILDNSTVIE